MKNTYYRDWFRRTEDESYTYYDKNKRLFDWDSNRKGYSSFFLKDNENLKSAAKMVSSMFRVVGVTKGTKYVNNSDQLNDNSVHVPLSMLKDKESGEYLNKDVELLDAFYGASIQNAAMKSLQNNTDYNTTINALRNQKSAKDFLFNVLNSERIIKKVGDKYPGYTRFIQKFKEHKFKHDYTPLDETESKGKRLLELITKFLRYPSDINENDVIEFEEPIKKIEDYIKKKGFPQTISDCKTQSSYIYNTIIKYIEEEEKNDGSCDSNGDGDGGKSEIDNFAQQLSDQLLKSEDGDSSDETLQEEFADFTEDMNEVKTNINYDKDGNCDESAIKFLKPDLNKSKYNKELKKIDFAKAQVLAKLFSRKCKDYAFSMKSMRSGRLDTNKIAEAKQMVPTIYERFGEVKTNKINIGVLIDESGSMGGDKIEKALQAAIFLNEIFSKVPDTRLYIYGHTADADGVNYGETAIRTYIEHGKSTNKYTLGSVKARANNRDGDAIISVAKRIRMQNEDPVLLFVISDGAPHAYGYDGEASIIDTRKKVNQAENLGMQVIQIAIEEYVPCEQMFNHYIKLTDMKTFPSDLVNFASKKIDKLIKTKVIF